MSERTLSRPPSRLANPFILLGAMDVALQELGIDTDAHGRPTTAGQESPTMLVTERQYAKSKFPRCKGDCKNPTCTGKSDYRRICIAFQLATNERLLTIGTQAHAMWDRFGSLSLPVKGAFITRLSEQSGSKRVVLDFYIVEREA